MLLGQAHSEGEGRAELAFEEARGAEMKPYAAVLALRQKHACAMGADSDAAGGERKKSTVGIILEDSQLGLVSMVLPGGPAYKKIKKGQGGHVVARRGVRSSAAARQMMMIVIYRDLTALRGRGRDPQPRRRQRHRGKSHSPPQRSAPRHALVTSFSAANRV
jgi:hypothetical protein